MADNRAQRVTSSTSNVSPVVSATPASAWLTPERVAHAEFRTGFRGLDATEVRAFLARVASELRTVLEREAELVAQLEAAEDRGTAIVSAPLDIQQVSEMLGQETARVLATARDAASDIKARAVADAAATVEAAAAEADRLRGEAAAVLGERTAEAEAAATEIVQRATAEAERLTTEANEAATSAREQGNADAERMRAEAEAALAKAAADADATREAAREEGRRMVAEARAVRERILTDMARRRNVARQQLERVRAARERLLEAIDSVRQNVADVQAELSGSLVDAKLAGERSARSVDVDDIPSLRDLDSEVELAKDSGLIDVQSVMARDEDLSVLDTGEFAAVTALEPEVDAPVPAAVEEPAVEEPAVEEAAPAVAEPVVVVDVRDEREEPAPEGGQPVPAAARSGRRTRSPKKADELFARLRAADESPVSHEDVPATGSAVVIGLAVAERADESTDAADEGAEAAATIVEPGSEAVVASGATAEAVNPDRVALHTRDALLAPTVRDLGRQLKLALSDQQNELLEAGRTAEGKEPAQAPSAEAMASVYVEAGGEALAAAFVAGRRSVRSGDRATARASEVAEQVTALAESIVDALRQRLGAGADNDGEPTELWPIERVRSAYREIRSQRLNALVEHAIYSAYAAGQLAAAPKGAMARWVCDSCGPDCLDNALAGPLPFGDTYPTGHVAPPSFAGCRCALVAVGDEG